MGNFIFLFVVGVFSLVGCSQLAHRSPESGYREQALSSGVRYKDVKRPNNSNYDRETVKTAYEMGLDPSSGLSGEDFQRVQDRMRLRDLERSLSSQKEKEQYSKVLPWLTDDEEKIEFLSIPSIEGRQAWINKQNIWRRSKMPDTAIKDIIETQDIAVGMPQDYVRRSWGEPASVEVSGNPLYKNERWKYVRQVSSPEGFRRETRYVYFEGGRVVGWETN